MRVKYRALLVSVVDEFHALLRQELFERDQYKALLAEANAERDGLRTDAARDKLAEVFEGIGAKWATLRPAQEIEGAITTLGDDLSAFNKLEVNKQLRAAIGVEVITVEPYLNTVLDAFVADNVALVKSVSSGRLPELERLVGQGLREGLRNEELRNRIEHKFGVTRSRASLIARDQVGKFNGELTELRQKKAGIEEYDWDTSQDERVRPAHASLQGTRQRWDDPPVVDPRTGRRANPGGDYQCRCNAIPVIPESLLRVDSRRLLS